MRLFLFLVLIQLCFSYSLNAQQLPPDQDYVTIKNGHLFYQNKRVRFWGAVGNFPGKNHADNEAVVKRLKSLGFNLVRYWREPVDGGSYTKGDGSRMDLIDHFMWCCQQNGVKIWYAGLNNLGLATPSDCNILNDQATENAWKEAITEKGSNIRNNMARIWDPRLHKLGIERMKKIADHVNQYNNLRYADDPNIVIWELSNEEWWFGHIATRFSSLPEYFRRELINQWNDFLHKKYGSEENIRKAWLGFLPGESFSQNTIMLLPLSKNAKAGDQRKALGVNITDGEAQQYGLNDVNGERGSDVVDFLTSIWYKHKRDEHQAMKAHGKSIALGSLCWDTGIGNEIQAQYLHQQADAVTHCTYISGFHHDPGAKRFPWYSGLEELPRLTWNDSWLEQNKVEEKPFFVYENQIHNPAKYRAEYPMRLVSLASINDWDVIVWHYFGPAPDANAPLPYNQPLDYTSSESNHPQGFHFQHDEVQQSAMTIASSIFRNFLLQPANNPTLFIFGKNSFLNPASMDYGGSYGKTKSKFIPTTYRFGSRILIDTTRTDDEIITLEEYKSRLAGNTPNKPESTDSKWSDGRDQRVYDSRVYEINPLKPTPEIEYDWQRGHLIFDSPGAVSYTGFLAQYGAPLQFKNGIGLSDVTIVNPDAMPYPVIENEKYIEFSVVSYDGKPLEKSSKIFISLVSTSFNSGFKLDHSKIHREFIWGAKENAGTTVSTGSLPVLTARVGASISLPMLSGMKYRMLDWHLNVLKSGTVEKGILKIPADLQVYIVELLR